MDAIAMISGIIPCPWCSLPVVDRDAGRVDGKSVRLPDPRSTLPIPPSLLDPFLDDSGELLGVRAWGHSCCGSDLLARALAAADAS